MNHEAIKLDHQLRSSIRLSIDQVLQSVESTQKPPGWEKLYSFSTLLLNRWFIEPKTVRPNHTSQELIIANHPGSLDLPLIIAGLYSPDSHPKLTIMVSNSTYTFYSHHFGQELFLPVGNNPRENQHNFNLAINKLNSGEQILLFPTGSTINQQPDTPVPFGSGVAYIVENIGPQTPILSIMIDPEYQLPLNRPRFRSPNTKTPVCLRHHFSLAGAWQSQTENLARVDAKKILTYYYLSQFNNVSI